MDAAATPVQFCCVECDSIVPPADVTGPCPDCGGTVRVTFDPDALPADPTALSSAPGSGIARYSNSLDVDLSELAMGVGGGNPIGCPTLETTYGVDSLAVVDEGRNPTGSAVDREMATAVATAVARGADRIVLPSTGHAAQSAAAYAGRANIESLAYVPSRTPFLNKAMTNVHGGELSVVEGRYSDAETAFVDDEATGFPVGPGSPFRRLGAATLAWDGLAGLDWTAPDAIVVPVSHGQRVAGMQAGLKAASEAGYVGSLPRLYAIQPEGCPPIADACQAATAIDSTDAPDTVIGPLEIPDPVRGASAVTAISESGGGAATVSDEDALAAAVDANASAGIECSATGGVALAGLEALIDRGAVTQDESVVVIDPLAAAGESDLLRSHLMSRGV
ncbi:pyridoxal-phosphate dependent enzyme [Halorhabdus sp. CBA1104]|uniref:pyridoxal-phosphate dependent enzyme n=1 Tax=unclassified Halorhabdus TaxID=2621901 RepID=UPI0012B22622|nr:MULTISPECIES: pyridoxal-phosphate dependent enzyme [unclassified Halorhabdus]QGN06620.1 pyridoxal-phosphate dependent enzyme [Halorhabdus sp. CBA1104]